MIEESVLEEAVELTEDEDVTASEYILLLGFCQLKSKFSRAIFGNGNWLILVINFTIFENFVPNLTIYAVMLHRAKYLKTRKNKLISTITFRQLIYILRIRS